MLKHNRITHWMVVLLVAALALAACSPAAFPAPSNSGSRDEAESSAGGAPAYEMPAATMAPYGTAAPAAMPQEGKGVDSAVAVTERMVIRNANLVLVVSDPAGASEQIAALAASLGGFTVNSYTYQASTDSAGNQIMQANITVRVPAEKLDGFLAQIQDLAVEVRTKNISGQDVTADYADLEARLRNLEAAEAQLVSILDKATKTEDVLAVFNQLTYIREQIEQIKGQMQYYAQSAALSAVTVELEPDILSQPIEVGGWRIEGVAREALEALVRAMQGLVTLGVWMIVYMLPLLLVIVLPIVLVVRFVLRRTRKPRPTPTA